MFSTSLSAAEADAVARDEVIQARADKLFADLPRLIDSGRRGMVAFVRSFDEGAALAEALIERFGPQSDFMARNFAFSKGQKLDDVEERRSPKGRIYSPQVVHVTAWNETPALAAKFVSEWLDPEVLAGPIIIALDTTRDAITRTRREPEPA